MDIQRTAPGFQNLALLAAQVVEGFISGMHKSPFHGFSAEFAEHKVYNQGESTKHIDWKLFARTDKLYTKRYDEETNLRCHLILDNSSSMHYPKSGNTGLGDLNKMGYAALASASIMHVLKKQRDAVGMSVYSDKYEFYAPEKGSDRHHAMLLDKLTQFVNTTPKQSGTDTFTYLHQIAEKLKRRSLVVFFSDLFQPEIEGEELFSALRHLKYDKHDVVFFHVYDGKSELSFDFDNRPRRYTDVETGEYIDIYADQVRQDYSKSIESYFKQLKTRCMQYGINYVPVDIQQNLEVILTTFLLERQRFK